MAWHLFTLLGLQCPLILFSFFFFFPFSNSTDTLTPIQLIKDGQTLISAREVFELGFFSPLNSKNRYVGIWYKKVSVQTIVWVANRENPISNSSGILTIIGGDLALIDGPDRTPLWSTNISTVTNYSSATLLDSGNLVLKDNNENVLWESFDYPTDSFLPGMKFGWDRRTGLNRHLTSWKTASDPARGEFSFGLDLRGKPQYNLMKGSDLIYRSGPWNGQRLGGLNISHMFSFQYVENKDEIYVTYTLFDSSIRSRLLLDASGIIQRLTWNERILRWNLAYSVPTVQCDDYMRCGPYSICDETRLPKSECTCLRGFEPRSAKDWKMGNWSGGCVRRRPLDCGKGDGFLKLARVKVPDTSRARSDPTLSLKECEEECLKNCVCTAYASVNISGDRSDCVMWDGALIDLKVFADGGQDLYTRVDASELDASSYKQSGGKKKVVMTVSTIIVAMVAFISCGYYWWRRKIGLKMINSSGMVINRDDFEGGKGSEILLLDADGIASSTNNFSESNMLGMGGFGPVYKGKLLSGQEIAVKRLSKSSGQGVEEFKNEISLIAKLQHKNLVRLFGCCIDGEEKMLIYEYMRNKSLDCFIFDQTRKAMLDWRTRYNIIVGIARGILYLHEDSRLRIIHRDLKVSNVLLDDEMNPKISDFGLARIFGGNQTQEKTNRVVGTYGYMSPEYAMNGLFSTKSDVFSFGIILLEIISGKKNNSYYNDCYSMTLTEYVWKLWKEDKILELADSSMNNSICQIEVLRCIQVGLLCVQESPEDRPNMSAVVFMLGNETMIPSPKQPAFCLQKGEGFNHLHSSNNETIFSKSQVTITAIEAR